MKKLTTTEKFKLACFADDRGALMPAAKEIVDRVKLLDNANNLAIWISSRYGTELGQVLSDREASRTFMKSLRKCFKLGA